MAKRRHIDFRESWDEMINSPVTETESESSDDENNWMIRMPIFYGVYSVSIYVYDESE